MEKKVKLHFVIPEECKNENEAEDIMKMAFQECVEAELSPTWLTADACLRIRATKNTVFVLQGFTGEIFKKLRSRRSVRLCGPMCIRSCINGGQPIPENKSPVFTTAMRDLIITASQLSLEAKAHVKELVGFMGGVYTSNLLETVTHLVTDAVRSAKYELACERGIPPMVPKWVDACWEESQKKNISATDPELLSKYKCPIFMNMTITCSNMSKNEKDEIKGLITKNGGTYTPQMRQNETTLLIVKVPQGDKYKFARTWGLPCVKPSYVFESVRVGYAVPSESHLVEPSVSCSTPTKNDDVPNFTCNTETSISMINFEISKTHIDDTQLTCTLTPTGQQPRPTRSTGSNHGAIVNSLSVSDAKKAGSFVDGCKIFFSGFTAAEGEKLRRIASLGGATVFSELSDSVSHVLVGEFQVQDMKTLMAMSQKPHVVTVDWLVKCVKECAPVNEEPFYCLETKKVVPEPPSPLSQKGMQLLQPPSSSQNEMPPPPEPPVSRKLFSEFLKENTKSPAKQPMSTTQASMNSTAYTDSTTPEIFIGLKFLIAGFNEVLTSDIEAAIQAAGGSVETVHFTGVADYAVVPVLQTVAPNITAVEVVTNIWLEDCLDQGEIVPVAYYHQPFSVDIDKKPLSDCCVSLSNYFTKEKAFLIELVQVLGATYQDVFARVAKEDKGVLPSTHLVCPRPDGQKYNAATRWGLPAITKDWLLGSARLGMKMAETPYLVADLKDLSTITQQRSKVVPTPSSRIAATPCGPATPSEPATTSGAITTRGAVTTNESVTSSRPATTSRPVTPSEPVNTVSCATPSGSVVTPAHRAVSSLKRKSTAQSPDDLSPFHVSTPDTPYGQVFETPTAETKKRWKKFIDDFPSRARSPPLPQKPPKRLSTPLSEIKRRIWAVALESSNENINPNYSIEDMDEDHGNATDHEELDIPSREETKTSTTTPLRGSKNDRNTSLLSSSAKGCENVEPRKFCPGRSTPTVDDFKSCSETPSSQSKSIDNLTRATKSPANEEACAMLGQLHKRLSIPSSVTRNPQPLPQRELVSPPEQHPTSQPRPVASTVLPESQPVLIGWEDPVESAERAKVLNSSGSNSNSGQTEKPRKFVLSNVSDKEKYEEKLKNLGETVITTSSYNNETTHLIVDEPVRSEKLLCCLAAGKWILHTSYIDAMEKHKRYLPEEEKYEWGNPLSIGNLPTVLPNTMEHQLASAAVRWRKQLSSGNNGAFTGMKAVLIASPSKYESYKRLVAAGGGEIVPATSILQATHCFVEVNKVSSMSVPLSQFVTHRVPCLPPIILGEMLTKFPPPPVEDGLISEYKRLLSLEGSGH